MGTGVGVPIVEVGGGVSVAGMVGVDVDWKVEVLTGVVVSVPRVDDEVGVEVKVKVEVDVAAEVEAGVGVGDVGEVAAAVSVTAGCASAPDPLGAAALAVLT